MMHSNANEAKHIHIQQGTPIIARSALKSMLRAIKGGFKDACSASYRILQRFQCVD